MVGPDRRQVGVALDLTRPIAAIGRQRRAASMISGRSHQSCCRRSRSDSIADRSSRSPTSRPSRADSVAIRSRKRCWESPSQVDVGLQQAVGVPVDGGERGAQLVAEPGQEVALQLLGAAERGGLAVDPLRCSPAPGPAGMTGQRPRAARRPRPGAAKREAGATPRAARAAPTGAGTWGGKDRCPPTSTCTTAIGRAGRTVRQCRRRPRGICEQVAEPELTRASAPDQPRHPARLLLPAEQADLGAPRPSRRASSATSRPSAERHRAGELLEDDPDRLEHPVARGDLAEQPVRSAALRRSRRRGSPGRARRDAACRGRGGTR